MKNQSVDMLSKRLQISKSTVSKALRHCDGVDTGTRNRILSEARHCGYRPESDCDIYCILPTVPQYFWKAAARAIRSQYTIKYNLYTNVFDTATVLHYLDEAEQMNARVIIVAAQPDAEVKHRLQVFAADRLVIVLSEYSRLTNCFYIGSDLRAEGAAMARLYLKRFPAHKPLVLRFTDDCNGTLRTEGFMQALTAADTDFILFPPIENSFYRENVGTVPARLAALLSQIADKAEKYCLYCPVGGINAPRAVRKAGMSGRTVCIGHDANPAAVRDGEFAAVCLQDIAEQAHAAALAADEYLQSAKFPPQKDICVPFKIQSIFTN